MNAGEGLVENDDVRVEHEQAAQFQELLLAAGERPAVLVPQMVYGEKLQDLHRLRVEVLPAPARIHGKRRHVEVLKHGHAAERAGHLKGAAEPGLRHQVGRQVVDARVVQIDGSAGRLDRAVQHICERGLAGAVRADQADQLCALHLEADALQDMQTAEVLVDTVDVQIDHGAVTPFPEAAARRRAWPRSPRQHPRVCTT